LPVEVDDRPRRRLAAVHHRARDRELTRWIAAAGWDQGATSTGQREDPSLEHDGSLPHGSDP
jgi:hypothetical protein